MAQQAGFGYADRLKPKEDLGGQLGATEYQDSVETAREKADSLAQLIQGSQEVFVFTGAGISTSAGIPDFRGPNGIWTLRKKNKPVPSLGLPFEFYKPSFTHMAIAALVATGKVKCVCSQNVDSLHLRSGIPRALLAELHGNCFAERCEACKREYTRDFQVETVDFSPTGRVCTAAGCSNSRPALLDNVLDWDSALPDDELDASEDAAKRSDVALVLGSSLQIHPANTIPTLTPSTKKGRGREKGKMVIINLQKTPKDRSAHMLVRARVDPMLARVMLQLGLSVPPYIRLDGVVVSHALLPAGTTTAAVSAQYGLADAAAREQGFASTSEPQLTTDSTWGFKIAVHSVHGRTCSLPLVRLVQLQLSLESSSTSQLMTQGPHIRVLCTSSSSSQAAAASSEAPLDQAPVPPAAVAQLAAPTQSPIASQAAAVPSQAPLTAVAHAPCHVNSIPAGGPFVFSVSNLPHHIARVHCRLSLQLVQWADADKQHVLLPDYTVSHPSSTGSTSITQAQPHTGSALAGLPTDTAVTAAMDGVGLSLPCHAHTAPCWRERAVAVQGGVGEQQGMQQGEQHGAAAPVALPPLKAEAAAPTLAAGASTSGGDHADIAVADHADIAVASADIAVASADIAVASADIAVASAGIAVASDIAVASAERREGIAASQQAHGSLGNTGNTQQGSTTRNTTGPQPMVSAQGPGFQIISFVSQEQHYDAAQEWHAVESDPPPVNLARVRGASAAVASPVKSEDDGGGESKRKTDAEQRLERAGRAAKRSKMQGE